ncbi:MAG: pyrroline-5-carboxylate reductase [Desulfobulbaceae bacterium]|nr:pyrroline-5-carboxylate reductase [Desulfobulbaceae bacterium]
MNIEGKIGFLGGGRMAEALIKGITESGLVKAEKVLAIDPAAERRQLLADQYGVATAGDGTGLADCRIIILAVKPQLMGKVLALNLAHFHGNQLVISIAAGISLDFLESCLNGRDCRLVRVMPNTPALVLEGASALCGGSRATSSDLDEARQIFEAVGSSVILSEADMDAVTGLSGSGPAYVFSFIEAMIDGGVKVGLARSVAEKLTLQTLLGSVRLAMSTGEHPAALRAMVTSPGGTTIAGLHEMERAGFQGIIMDAVEAATCRSRELGRLAAEKKGV